MHFGIFQRKNDRLPIHPKSYAALQDIHVSTTVLVPMIAILDESRTTLAVVRCCYPGVIFRGLRIRVFDRKAHHALLDTLARPPRCQDAINQVQYFAHVDT